MKNKPRLFPAFAAALVLQAGVAPRKLEVGTLQRRLEQEGAYLGRSW